MQGETYVCAVCGGEFSYCRSDEEAEEECEQLFGVSGASKRPNMSIVCDDCFKQMDVEPTMRAMKN